MDWSEVSSNLSYVLGKANFSRPLPGVKSPGMEFALHRYPESGNIWLFERQLGRKHWIPQRAATEAEIEYFRRKGSLFGAKPAASSRVQDL